MTDEESMSEGFSASEDEWKPSKHQTRGGESSDDDDSDFEESSPIAAVSSASSVGKKRGERETKVKSVKQTATKKKPGLSLRAKLYNKYRPLPKTCSPPSSDGKNSPSASTSRMNSKNAKVPNESRRGQHNDNDEEGSSSDGSIDNYFVDPDELDIQSSFFNVDKTVTSKSSASPIPDFDCNAGMGNLSDSAASEDAENNDFDKGENTKAFDFRDLLENANSLERVKESLAKQAAEEAAREGTAGKKSLDSKIDAMDVYSLLALGEKQHRSHNDGEDEDDEEEEEEDALARAEKERRGKGPAKLSKTKSTRVKRHTKTRPASTVVAGGDTDDSDFEEVADTSENADTTATSDISHGNLEIHIELPSSKQRDKKTRTQQDLEMALKRKFNRDMKERQVLMHKASLLCHFGRTYFYNRLLNDTILMQKALKLLPSKNAYPPAEGTEIRYYQSLVTWFKGAISLNSQNLYPPDKKAGKTKVLAHRQLMQQIETKQARCKQDMLFIFIILLRGMGLQVRLVNNMQPLPLKPSQSDLISMKIKQEDKDKDQGKAKTDSMKKVQFNDRESDSSKNDDKPSTSSKAKLVRQEMVKPDLKYSESAKEKQHANASKKDTSSSTKRADKTEGISGKATKTISSKSSSNSKPSRDDESKPKKTTTSVPGDDESKSSKEKSKAGPKIVSAKKKVDTKQLATEKQSKTTKTTHTEGTQKPVLKTGKSVVFNESDRMERSRKPAQKANSSVKSFAASETEVILQQEEQQKKPNTEEDGHFSKTEELENSREENSSKLNTLETPPSENKAKIPAKVQHEKVIKDDFSPNNEELDNSQKENSSMPASKKTNLARLKRGRATEGPERPPKKKPVIETGTPLIPTIVVKGGEEIKDIATDEPPTTSTRTRVTRSRSKSPQIHISSAFMETKHYKEKFPRIIQQKTNIKNRQQRAKSPIDKPKISPSFLSHPDKKTAAKKRILRSCQKTNEGDATESNVDSNLSSLHLQIPQMDGANDDEMLNSSGKSQSKKTTRKKKIKKENPSQDSDEDFEPSPIKKPKLAPSAAKRDRRVLSTDEDENIANQQNKPTAGDMWVEVWSDVEEQWVCVDIFKGKIHCVDSIRKSASSNMAYVFAFQNDLSIKDVTARYSPHWTTVVRKSRIDKLWLDTAIHKYQGRRTKRDIKEDQELRRIHEQKPMPTSIGDYKNHPFYALERHLLKFEAIYPPTAPTLGYIRSEAVYSRDCVHTLHSRDIWLKQARVVKLGEKPYKIVKARPKWDRITQTVIKDQPLEIFGYWQTQEYDPPTAENGMVPRNAYGNVELFKPTMLPKKCVHIRLPGLNRVCKKLGIDCANAVIGFDFHQGSCHPTYDGFVVCEEFLDQVTAAWYQDQEEQERKEQEKYEARVYGNWKKLIRGLLIRERLKLKYGV